MTQNLKEQLAEHFFRHQYGKTVSHLVRYFGLSQIQIAEDIVQDTLIKAMEAWSVHGIPDNPGGWVTDVARKKTINYLKREHNFKTNISKTLSRVSKESDENTSKDSTLRLIFACCHPSIPSESQIALALKTLCGLSISEIARALLTNNENVNKRLYRARIIFREQNIDFSIPVSQELENRLYGVYKTLYVLFNEGYYDPHHEESLRIDLCYEAIRLLKEVLYTFPNSSEGNGLLSLMLLSMARFKSRLDLENFPVALEQQNRQLWDLDLIHDGLTYLEKSITQNTPNQYQLQAGIAAEYCLATNFDSTNWKSVLQQYDLLEQIDPNPFISFNKAIAMFFSGEKQKAIESIQKLSEEKSFKKDSNYHLALGILFNYMGNMASSKKHLERALDLTQTERERLLIHVRIAALDSM